VKGKPSLAVPTLRGEGKKNRGPCNKESSGGTNGRKENSGNFIRRREDPRGGGELAEGGEGIGRVVGEKILCMGRALERITWLWGGPKKRLVSGQM